MKLFRIGTKVLIGKDIRATILNVQIGPTGINYECSWWNGRVRIVQWITSCEVNNGEETFQIGFKKG